MSSVWRHVCTLLMWTGGDVGLGGEQAPERRVPAVGVRQISRRVGQVSSLGRHARRLLKQRPLAHSDTATLVSSALAASPKAPSRRATCCRATRCLFGRVVAYCLGNKLLKVGHVQYCATCRQVRLFVAQTGNLLRRQVAHSVQTCNLLPATSCMSGQGLKLVRCELCEL